MVFEENFSLFLIIDLMHDVSISVHVDEYQLLIATHLLSPVKLDEQEIALMYDHAVTLKFSKNVSSHLWSCSAEPSDAKVK